jgi:hypothetical protein
VAEGHCEAPCVKFKPHIKLVLRHFKAIAPSDWRFGQTFEGAQFTTTHPITTKINLPNSQGKVWIHNPIFQINKQHSTCQSFQIVKR